MHELSFVDLSIAAIPALIVIGILFRWQLNAKTSIYAMARMLLQLLVVGFFLTFIFESDNYWIVLAVLLLMLSVSSWIALRTVEEQRLSLYGIAFIASILGGGLTLILITQISLSVDPWYAPQMIIPLAGMIFASSMNSISIAAERLKAELDRGVEFVEARNTGFKASLIPTINSLFAVGLVSLPGMMTGQILSGVSPFVAARYQIMVMFMIFGATGIAAACYLMLYSWRFQDTKSDDGKS